MCCGGPAAYPRRIVDYVSVGDKVSNADSDEIDMKAVKYHCTSNCMAIGGEGIGATRWLLDGGSGTTLMMESLVPKFE